MVRFGPVELRHAYGTKEEKKLDRRGTVKSVVGDSPGQIIFISKLIL